MPYKAQIQATLGGAAPTLAEYLADLIAQHGGADWPLNDASGRIADNRAYTAALGAGLLSNSDFSAFTGDDPTGWTILNENDTTRLIEANANGARFLDTDGTSTNIAARQGTLTQGVTYQFDLDMFSVAEGTFQFGVNEAGGIASITAAGQYTFDWIPQGSNVPLLQSIATTANAEGVARSLQCYLKGDLDALVSATGVSFQQTGETGAANAMDFNGSAGMLSLIAQTTLQGMTDFIAGGMINPDATGANDRLLFKSAEFDVIFNADGTISVTINYSGTNATLTTVETFSTGAWQHFAVGISSVDNLARVYKNGVECTYTSPVAGVGTRVSNSNQLQFFKDASTNGFDGKAQKLFLLKTAPTAALAAQIYALRNS